jgi:hypothetical protein
MERYYLGTEVYEPPSKQKLRGEGMYAFVLADQAMGSYLRVHLFDRADKTSALYIEGKGLEGSLTPCEETCLPRIAARARINQKLEEAGIRFTMPESTVDIVWHLVGRLTKTKPMETTTYRYTPRGTHRQ